MPSIPDFSAGGETHRGLLPMVSKVSNPVRSKTSGYLRWTLTLQWELTGEVARDVGLPPRFKRQREDIVAALAKGGKPHKSSGKPNQEGELVLFDVVDGQPVGSGWNRPACLTQQNLRVSEDKLVLEQLFRVDMPEESHPGAFLGCDVTARFVVPSKLPIEDKPRPEQQELIGKTEPEGEVDAEPPPAVKARMSRKKRGAPVAGDLPPEA